MLIPFLEKGVTDGHGHRHHEFSRLIAEPGKQNRISEPRSSESMQLPNKLQLYLPSSKYNGVKYDVFQLYVDFVDSKW